LGSAGPWAAFLALGRLGWPWLPLALAFLGLLFLPLVRPWRLRYKRQSSGRAQTLVGAQGQRRSKASTTQSWPQEQTLRALLDSRGSWCMPVP